MADLNALASQTSSLYLYVANDINDLGEIVGQAVDPVTGNAPAFLATPTSAGEYGEAAAEQVDENAGTKLKVVLPEKVLKSLQQRNGFRRFELVRVTEE